eukprot:403333733
MNHGSVISHAESLIIQSDSSPDSNQELTLETGHQAAFSFSVKDMRMNDLLEIQSADPENKNESKNSSKLTTQLSIKVKWDDMFEEYIEDKSDPKSLFSLFNAKTQATSNLISSRFCQLKSFQLSSNNNGVFYLYTSSVAHNNIQGTQSPANPLHPLKLSKQVKSQQSSTKNQRPLIDVMMDDKLKQAHDKAYLSTIQDLSNDQSGHTHTHKEYDQSEKYKQTFNIDFGIIKVQRIDETQLQINYMLIGGPESLYKISIKECINDQSQKELQIQLRN